MTIPPQFYESIREAAAQRWDQLEKDPELAGPWRQLFKQVQSPRHIFSELLQNADDAGATEAFVDIENQTFVFKHNGEDFSEDHFKSLCRFGYSNKQALHTIGFRGIGFKSVFSLGGAVKLFTPSLAVQFHHERFTEPHWIQEPLDTRGKTCIVVEISDQHRQKEIEKNLKEWLRSPLSLIFFKNIRQININGQKVRWNNLGVGPVPGSERMVLNGDEGKTYLLIRSSAESFPEEALLEIKQERMLGNENDADFPPCTIEIVAGATGRLYVVLPTGVETKLPFSCNAPFVQDPARVKIKDPETSPTNRWLLERAGKLAASSMSCWLEQPNAPLSERAQAYSLLPDVDRDEETLPGVCAAAVELAFASEMEGRPLLLNENGGLALKGRGIIIPEPLLDVWPADQAASVLDDERRPALCRHIDAGNCEKLLNWGFVSAIDKNSFIEILKNTHLPKPKSWRQLMNLWAYIAPDIVDLHSSVNAKNVCIVPVQGKNILYAAHEVVRLGEKKLLQSDGGWEFLATYLVVLNQNWPRFLAEHKRTSLENNDAPDMETNKDAYAVLKEIGLSDASDANRIINQVAAELFAREDAALKECVQIAQIAAKLSVAADYNFKYFTRDQKLQGINANILFDVDDKLEELLPEEQRKTKLLHQDYSQNFTSCSSEDWLKWVASGHSGLRTFVPIMEFRPYLGRYQRAEKELKQRGFMQAIETTYKDPTFYIRDWDFESTYWEYWQNRAAANPAIWSVIAGRILNEKEAYWSNKLSAQIFEQSKNGHQRAAIRSGLRPSWALKLSSLPCLPDMRETPRRPGELMRRTRETESFLDVEPFVDRILDREAVCPLLDLLGVRNTPTGPARLLDCLRTLSQADQPPAYEVEQWYNRLDQMLSACSTEEAQTIKQSFQDERLIFTQNDIWETSSAVFLLPNEENILSAEVIRASVRDLTLWRKIGVADQITADIAVSWLQKLQPDAALKTDEIRRVRYLLAQHPHRIWKECGCWLNLTGKWVSAKKLSYSITMQSLAPWEHLHSWVKQATADFRVLLADMTMRPPFSEFPSLARCIEERLDHELQFFGDGSEKNWLRALGDELCRIKLENDDETQRIRELANRLVYTKWYETPTVKVIPYIDGEPAGLPRKKDILWLDQKLYVNRLPKAKMARRIPEEIGKIFNNANIQVALSYSFERPVEDIREYVEENFNLSPRVSNLVEESNLNTPEITESGLKALSSSAHEERGHADDGVESSEDVGYTESIDMFNPETQEINIAFDEKYKKSQPTMKTTKPAMISRYAQMLGFKRDNKDRFYHEDGSCIVRTSSSVFSWEHFDSSGNLMCCYWAKDHCLEREPLKIESDVWDLLTSDLKIYALILSDTKGSPKKIIGSRLQDMKDKKEIILYPASYRIAYEADADIE